MLEKICTDLETSKRLKELGFEAETDFYWTITTIDEWNKNQWNIIYFKDRVMAKYEPTVPAYTLEQILKELPKSFNSGALRYNLNFDYTEECIEYKWISDEPYTEDKILIWELRDIADNFATTAAKLWIKLKEDKII